LSYNAAVPGRSRRLANDDRANSSTRAPSTAALSGGFQSPELTFRACPDSQVSASMRDKKVTGAVCLSPSGPLYRAR
jgi:hypothetical protein